MIKFDDEESPIANSDAIKVAEAIGAFALISSFDEQDDFPNSATPPRDLHFVADLEHALQVEQVLARSGHVRWLYRRHDHPPR